MICTPSCHTCHSEAAGGRLHVQGNPEQAAEAEAASQPLKLLPKVQSTWHHATELHMISMIFQAHVFQAHVFQAHVLGQVPVSYAVCLSQTSTSENNKSNPL